MNLSPAIFWSGLALSAAILLGLASLGMLSSRAFAGAPNRRIGLCPCNKTLVIDLLLVILFALAGSLVAEGVLTAVFGPITRSDLPTTDRLIVQLTLQLAQLGPLALLLVLEASRRRRGLRRIGLVPRRPLRDLGIAVVGLLIALVLVATVINVASVIGQWCGLPLPPKLGHPLLREMARAPDVVTIVLVGVQAVVLAPLLEESIFRGLLQSSLVELFGAKRRWPAILLVAALFAAAHTSLGGSTGVNWQALPGLLVLGVILGWVYERTGDLWTNIFIHAGFNACQILLALSIMHYGF